MPILFIHGLFQALHQVPPGWMCPDLPGYGAHAAPGSVGLMEAVEFLRGLIVEPTHLVGHSIGGAIAVLMAAEHPECVASVVNVEGNFTLKDAFWSSRLAAMTEAEAERDLSRLRTDPASWLTGADVPVTPAALTLAARSLATPVRTIQAMAASVVEITSRSSYLDQVRRVLDYGVPFHLLTGERSRKDWDVPDFVLQRAASFEQQPDAGHTLMLNDQPAFVSLVEGLLR